METTACWKKIWITTTGTNKNVTLQDADKVLKLVGDDLCLGIVQHKPFVNKSFEEWKSAINLKDADNILENFIRRLSIYLDLETPSAWKVFCNFLIFEYYGKVGDIKQIARFEMYAKHLFQHIWLFYSSERMFMIKTMKHMLEKSLDQQHQFYNLYCDYFKPPRLHDVRIALIKQFECLLNEIHGDNINHCTDFSDWVDRNMREQIEILSSLVLTVEHSPLLLDELKSLLQLFKEHNFGKDPKCYQILTVMNPTNLGNLKAIEIGLFLLGLLPCWERTTFWYPRMQELENIILSILSQEDCPIIPLAWATLQMTLPERVAQDSYINYYYKFTRLALQQNVFACLYEAASTYIFQKCEVGKIVKTAIYVLLEHVSEKFSESGIIFTFDQSNALVGNLLSEPELTQRFTRTGTQRTTFLYENAAQLFPVTFDSFTITVNALLQYPKLFKTVSDNLTKLEYFTEEYNDEYFDDSITLFSDYRPHDSGSILIPAKSEAKIFRRFNKVLITYKTRYTYFNVLEDLINDAIGKNEPPEDTRNSIYLGLQLIKIVLDNSERNLLPIRKCINLVSAVFGKFTKRPIMDFKLIKICVDIYISLLEVDELQVMEILAVNNFLPDIIKDPLKVENYFHKNFFVPGVFFMAMQEEIATGEYELLFALFRLLKNSLTKKHQLKIQIPSIVLLFVHIFPVHLEWNYKDMQKKSLLTYECTQILFEILQQKYSLLETTLDKTVYNFCYEVLISYEPFFKVFMRLLRVPNVYLHAHIEKEFNWNNISDLNIVKTVRTSLTIVLILYNKHNNYPKPIFSTPFSALFFKEDIKPSMLKIIAGYINHTFDKSISKLSCQLLKKFAAYSKLPVLSLLEMDSYQIQCMFLEKIRDPLEDDCMKIAILNLITFCIEKQNGMTAAFFNASNIGLTNCSENGDTIITFLEEYLQNTKKSADYLGGPIQAAILDLFHKLWMCQKDILIRDLIQQEKFWSSLVDPLFKKLTLNNKTYSEIFNILTFELFKCNGKSVKLDEVLIKMFVETDCFTKKWTIHLIGALEKSERTHGAVLLKSWKNMLIAILKFFPSYLEKLSIRHLLTQNCLDGLLQHFEYPNIRLLTEWAELYLYLITFWPTNYYKDGQHMFITLAKIFQYLGEYYENVGNVCKENLLLIAIKTVQDLQYLVKDNSLLVDNYLHSIGKIFEKEYIKIMTEEYEEADVTVTDKTYKCWLLLLIFGNKLIKLGFAESHPSWFRLIDFMDKLLTSIGPFIKMPRCFPIAKISVQCLVNYAQTPLLKDFLYVNLDSFFDSTRPPKRYIKVEELSSKTAIPWYFEEWWLTYSGVVQLMAILVRKFGHYKLDTFFSYIHIHDDIIKNCLMLPMVTAEGAALQLVSACLNFCHALLKWRTQWKLHHPQLYFSYLQSINITVNAISNIFIRPKILQFFRINKESKLILVENVPISIIIGIMNPLMEVLGYCNLCLIRSSPDLMDLLEVRNTKVIDDVGIQYDFHVPQICEEHPEHLNYGTVLCILHFLCKTLTHIKSPNTSHEHGVSDAETGFIAFVCPDFIGGYTISERYNSVQTFAASEISAMSAPWLTKLDVQKVNFALETLNTFLASQTFLTMHTRHVKYNELMHIKRELCSELLFFHEFIRKRMIEQCHYRVIENMVFRKLILISLPYTTIADNSDKVLYARQIKSACSRKIDDDDDDDEEEDNDEDVRSSSKRHDHSKDIEALVFYTPDMFENICSVEISSDSPRRNVNQESRSKMLSRPLKKVFYGTHSWQDGCSSQIPIEKVTLNYAPAAPITEGDYLLLLSHWFIFICNLSH